MLGPKGKVYPADAVSCAVMIGKTATSEIEDVIPAKRQIAL